ncbi:MAG: ABC transporter ATP-binding protein/permease [Clostridiales bacterium]|jgi:ATP-binding cassette subfamily B protein|nr:ABC transporter ATP-binding protein/permease [Clostridiales bacterium]
MINKWKKLFSYYKKYKKLFFIYMFFALLNLLIKLLMPLIVFYITEKAIFLEYRKAFKTIINLSELIIILVIFNSLFEYITIYYGHLFAAKIEVDMRNEVFEHLQNLSLSFYKQTKIGKIMSRITNELTELSDMLMHAPETFFSSFLKITISFTILFSINRIVTLITFSIIPPIAIFSWFFSKKMSKAFNENDEKISDLSAVVEDSLSGISTIKSFSNEKIEVQKFKKSNLNYYESLKNANKQVAILYAGIFLVTDSLPALVTACSVILLLKNKFSTSEMVIFFMYINLLTETVFIVASRLELIENSFAGYKRFIELLSIKPEIIDSPNAIKLKKLKGKITFKNVTFKFKKEDKKDILSNLNFEINAGEYVAIVGYSGTGKTTICNLISRFYDTTSGSILIDEKNIKNIKIKNLRKNIGYVQQDVYLFAGSINENIKYGKIDATNEEVIEAAKKSYAHDFIIKLEHGYDTDIGQRGTKLSGGQKQRLAISRVFLKNPPILIFDEATSALDNESEEYIQKSLEELAKNRTTIVIAHRLSTIKNAQKILVMADTGIVEIGTHEELINKKGTYFELYGLKNLKIN